MKNKNHIRWIGYGCIAFSLFVIVLGLLIQFVPSVVLPNKDSGVFLNTGSQLLKGKLLYVDVWDHKGPAIYFLNAVGLFITNGSQWGVWILELGFLFLSTLVCFQIGSQLADSKTGLLINLYWLYGLGLLIAGNLTEEYNLLFQFLAIWCFWKWLITDKKSYLVLIGFVTGLGFLLRANLIAEGLSAAIIILWVGLFNREYKKASENLFWILIGTVVVIGSVGLYFHAIRILDEAIFASLTYNFIYSSTTFPQRLDALVYGLKSIKWLLPISILGMAVVVHVFSRKSESDHSRKFFLFLVISGLLNILFSIVSGRSYSHYYITWLPSIAIIGGYATIQLLQTGFSQLRVPSRISQVVILALLTLLGLIMLMNKFEKNISLIKQTILNHHDVDLRITKYIRQNSNPDDYVLAWGYENYINFRSRRDSPSRFAHQFPLYGKSPISEKWSEEFYTNIKSKKPVFIISPPIEPERSMTSIPPLNIDLQNIWLEKNGRSISHGLKETIIFINNNYRMIENIDGWNVYKYFGE